MNGVTRLIIRAQGRLVFVGLDEVDYISAHGNYVRVHCGPDSHRLRGTLQSLLARLDPARFARIHRGTILNLDRIVEVKRLTSGDCMVMLRGGQTVRMSRKYAHAVLMPLISV